MRLKASDASDLASDDLFYFGNAVGESGNLATNAIVSSSDEMGARLNPHTPTSRASITDQYDYNRDGLVNGADQMLARMNATTPISALKLIAAPASMAGIPLSDTRVRARSISVFSQVAITERRAGSDRDDLLLQADSRGLLESL